MFIIFTCDTHQNQNHHQMINYKHIDHHYYVTHSHNTQHNPRDKVFIFRGTTSDNNRRQPCQFSMSQVLSHSMDCKVPIIVYE